MVPRRVWDVKTIVLFFDRPGRGSVKTCTEKRNSSYRTFLGMVHTNTHTHVDGFLRFTLHDISTANVCFLWLGVRREGWRVCFRIPLQQAFPDPSSKWHPHNAHTHTLTHSSACSGTRTETNENTHTRRTKIDFPRNLAGSKHGRSLSGCRRHRALLPH